MKVEVLTTPGCSSCKVLENMLENLGLHYDLIDITEKPEYLKKYPIFVAPGLVLDGKLVFSGVPKIKDLRKIIQ